MSITTELVIDEAASTLESEVIPALDDILMEAGEHLRASDKDDIRRAIALLEEVFSSLNNEY